MDENSYWQRYWRRRLTRRGLLRGTALGVAGLTAAAIVGCGEGEEGPAATTPAATRTPAATATPAATPTVTPVTPVRGGTLRLRVARDLPTLDPDRTNNTYTKAVVNRIYSKLYSQTPIRYDEIATKFPPTDIIATDAAESMPEITDDGLTYIIKLRGDVKYQPPLDRFMDADDVVFAFKRLRGELPGVDPSPAAGFFSAVDKIEATDAQTIVFRLKQPFAPFTQYLSDDYNLILMPKETGDAFDPTKTCVGSGPFLFKEHIADVSTNMTRYPEWNFGPDMPYVDEVQQIVVPEFATALNQFLAGNLDQIGTIPASDLKTITSEMPDATIFQHPNTYTVYIGFSPQDPEAPWRKDPRLRQALSLAIDRDALFESLYPAKEYQAAGLEPPPVEWQGFIPNGFREYWVNPKTDPKLKPYFEYNPEKAKALLAEAGFPDGISAPFHYTTGFGPLWAKQAEVILQMVAQVGIKLEAKVDDFRAVYYPKVFRGEYDGLAQMYHGPSEVGQTLADAYLLDGSRNISKFDDPALFEEIGKMQGELNPDKRKQMIRDIQYELAEKMYEVPTVYDAAPGNEAWAPRVRGFLENITNRGGTGQRDPRLWIAA